MNYSTSSNNLFFGTEKTAIYGVFGKLWEDVLYIIFLIILFLNGSFDLFTRGLITLLGLSAEISRSFSFFASVRFPINLVKALLSKT